MKFIKLLVLSSVFCLAYGNGFAKSYLYDGKYPLEDEASYAILYTDYTNMLITDILDEKVGEGKKNTYTYSPTAIALAMTMVNKTKSRMDLHSIKKEVIERIQKNKINMLADESSKDDQKNIFDYFNEKYVAAEDENQKIDFNYNQIYMPRVDYDKLGNYTRQAKELMVAIAASRFDYKAAYEDSSKCVEEFKKKAKKRIIATKSEFDKCFTDYYKQVENEALKVKKQFDELNKYSEKLKP